MDTIKDIAVDKICWCAILAGLVITLAGESLLNLLGLGLGLTAFTADADVISNIGTGSLIWLILSGIICMFIGGWVAGRLANIHFYLEGVLHGLVTWGLATLLTILLMATTAGSLISGVTSAVGQIFSFTGQSITTLGKGIAQIAPQFSAGNNVIPDMNKVLQNVQVSDQASLEKIKSELQDDITTFMSATNENDVINAKLRLIDFLVKNNVMNQSQAEQKVNEWQQKYNSVKQEMKEKSIAATEQASTALGKVAITTFFVFLLSAIAGAVGGLLGVINKRKSAVE